MLSQMHYMMKSEKIPTEIRVKIEKMPTEIRAKSEKMPTEMVAALKVDTEE